MMNCLLFLILIKLFITVFFLAGPFLLFNAKKLDALMRVSGDHTIIYRLYGMAMLALATAYGGGAWQVWSGTFPWTIVWMGTVSNLGAGLLLFFMGKSGFLKAAAFVFLGIGLAFAVSALYPDAVMKVWG